VNWADIPEIKQITLLPSKPGRRVLSSDRFSADAECTASCWHGKIDKESAPFPGFALHPDLSAVRFNRQFAVHQSQARSCSPPFI
jgi:hypothetical protein